MIPTENEMKLGAKEALQKGIELAVHSLSKEDGFLKTAFKIPFPEDAIKVKNTLDKIGLKSLTEKIITTLNKAAEDATTEALPIFSQAIKNLTFQDIVTIIKGNKNEATQFLRKHTESQLTKLYLPKIKNSLDKVNATKYWGEAMTRYNSIPLVTKMNPDLGNYVTTKAMNALFTKIALQEELIRKNPVERTTELLKKVFGYYKKN